MNHKLYSKLMATIIGAELPENVVIETVMQLMTDLVGDKEGLDEGDKLRAELAMLVPFTM